MKRFLSVGEGYGRSWGSGSPAQPQMDKVFSLLLCAPKVTGMVLLVAFFWLFWADRAKAQGAEAPSQYSKLKIGQKAPRNVLIGDPVFNSERQQISTNDFRRRAVIIDIWATWCGSCIARFQKLDSLQRVYTAHLDFYLLNNLYRDSEEKIETFLSDYKGRFPDFSLPILIGNDDSRALFPGESLPHYIWIDTSGRVKAITGSEAITGPNIERLIAGLSIDVKEKVK